MEDEIRVGDYVGCFNPSLGLTFHGTVVEVDGDLVKAEIDKPIKYFTTDKHNIYRIKEGENGNSRNKSFKRHC